MDLAEVDAADTRTHAKPDLVLSWAVDFGELVIAGSAAEPRRQNGFDEFDQVVGGNQYSLAGHLSVAKDAPVLHREAQTLIFAIAGFFLDDGAIIDSHIDENPRPPRQQIRR